MNVQVPIREQRQHMSDSCDAVSKDPLHEYQVKLYGTFKDTYFIL